MDRMDGCQNFDSTSDSIFPAVMPSQAPELLFWLSGTAQKFLRKTCNIGRKLQQFFLTEQIFDNIKSSEKIMKYRQKEDSWEKEIITV